MKIAIKKLAERIPYCVGKYLVGVPYQFRLGAHYTDFSDILKQGHTEEQAARYSLQNFNLIFNYAKSKFPFYKELYQEYGVENLSIQNFDDIKKLPIVNKDMLRGPNANFSGTLKLNTGGTTGTPLAFYVDKNAFAREWAHMHFIWALRGYNYRSVKLTLRGRNLGKHPFVYNCVHNEFIVNTYLPITQYAHRLLGLILKVKIKFIHGYPSAIYNFLRQLENYLSDKEFEALKSCISCCLLGSEYPPPYVTKYLSDTWEMDYISWYGHSEMCILAFDSQKNGQYAPMQTYGYAEVDSDHLLGTSFHNYDMPLIRYDTGDRVQGQNGKTGLLESFRITEGRIGDFIEDLQGNAIPLTALIFGRHHKIFDYANSVQIYQARPGQAIFFVVLQSEMSSEQALTLFDTGHVNIQFGIKFISKPILSPSGKMLLKILHPPHEFMPQQRNPGKNHLRMGLTLNL